MKLDLRPLEIQVPLSVKTYDIDFAGVVSNIVYVRWLEDLRIEMLARYLPLNELLNEGIAPLIVQTKIDYKKSIQLFDQPIGKMWVNAIGKVRWTVSAEITVNDHVAILGEQIGIFIDIKTNRPLSVPERLKQQYHEWQTPP